MTRALPDARHRSAPAPAGSAAGRLRRIVPAVSVVVPAAATLAVQATSPVAQQVPAGAAGFDLAAAWLATSRGALSGAAAWFTSPLLGRLQLGALIRALGGGQTQSVLGAAHGAMLLMAVALTVLTWAAVRRSGSGPVVAGVVAAVTGIAPEAVVVHSAPSAAAFGTLWLLIAAAVVGRPQRSARIAGGVAAVLAVLSSPTTLAVVGVAVGVVVLRARSGRGSGGWGLVAIAGGTSAAVLLVVAVVLRIGTTSAPSRALDAVTAAQGGPAAGVSAVASWLVVDPLLLLAVLVAGILCAQQARSRPVAIVVLLLLAGSFWPLGADGTGPVVVLLPVAAVAIAITMDRAFVLLADPVFVRSAIGSSWLTGVAAVLLVGVVVWLSGLGSLLPGSALPSVRAERWVRGGVPAGQTLVAGLGVWPDLTLGGSGAGWYAAVPGVAAVPASVPWSAVQYILADTALLGAGATGGAGAALARSSTVVTFGAGSQELAVRAVRPSGTPSPSASPTPSAAPSTEAQRQALAARREAGSQLAANARITLDAADRAALVSGAVDARIALVLAQFATTHRVTVAAFGLAPGDTTGIRTTVVVSAVDGSRVPQDAAATGDLLRYLSALRGDFATTSIDAGSTGITAVFPADPGFVPSS